MPIRRLRRLGGLLALCLAALPLHAQRLVVIDQDAFGPAGSNLQSILMAIQSPDVRVLGITVESGDGWCAENVAHTLRMLEIIGRTDIPVVAGPSLPLLNTPEATRRWEARYGKLAYKGAWTEAWPSGSTVPRAAPHAADVVPPLAEGEPHARPLAEPAAQFLVRTVRAHPGQVSILALGPLTNVALASKLDPAFPRLARELVYMGGSFAPRAPPGGGMFALEYADTPRLEFNFRFDPEAASIVLHQPWRRLVQVPVDPTTDTMLRADMVARIAGAGTPLAGYLARYAQPGFPMWDELAAAVWLDPGLVRRRRKLLVDVDTDHGAGYGNILSWEPGRGPGLGEQPAEVVFEVDVARLERLFIELMSRPTPPAAP